MDLFSKRMKMATINGSLGNKLTEESNVIENITFSNDVNYRKGMLYDWDMNELEEVEFKFEKTKERTVEGTEVEYTIHFRPNYNPEFKYKDLYYKKDGRERLGFYIDVYDSSKDIYEKWLIISKDDRVAFDRYKTLRCNWCFEWVYNEKYYNCLGCIREASDNAFNSSGSDTLGGSTVDGEFSMVLPTNQTTCNLLLGTKFMITDNLANPQVYEVIKIKDTSPLGTTRAYLKQRVFNPHTDFIGIINDEVNSKFIFDLPLDDLPETYGGKYHMICNCLKTRGLPLIEEDEMVEWKIENDDKYIYINGSTLKINAKTSIDTTTECEWHFIIDNTEYQIDDLKDYFDINIDGNFCYIKAINKVMAKYILTVAIYDTVRSYYDSIDLEVRL